jgi:hypothetical protein
MFHSFQIVSLTIIEICVGLHRKFAVMSRV